MKYLKTYERKDGITFKEWLKIHETRLSTTYIDCSLSKLIDLDGIKDFKKLEYLDCSYNRLNTLPDLSVLKNLYSINCSNNKLTELPDLINLTNLIYLDCSHNKLPFYCSGRMNNLFEYLEWHKKEYPWIYDAKKYNL
jgi:Leucine-rich repeat (LRR) protein